LQAGSQKFTVGSKQTGAARIEVNLPALSDPAPKNPVLQELSVHAESNGQPVGDVKIRVELRKKALPE